MYHRSPGYFEFLHSRFHYHFLLRQHLYLTYPLPGRARSLPVVRTGIELVPWVEPAAGMLEVAEPAERWVEPAALEAQVEVAAEAAVEEPRERPEAPAVAALPAP